MPPRNMDVFMNAEDRVRTSARAVQRIREDAADVANHIFCAGRAYGPCVNKYIIPMSYGDVWQGC